jgi:hypothetical protein
MGACSHKLPHLKEDRNDDGLMLGPAVFLRRYLFSELVAIQKDSAFRQTGPDTLSNSSNQLRSVHKS